jgi:predicted N-acyltransferase
MTSDSRSIEAYDDPAGLPGEEWDALLGRDDFYLSTRWLQVVQQTARVPIHHLLLRRGDATVAALTIAQLDQNAPWLLGRPDTLLAHSAETGLPGAAACRADLPVDLDAALLPGLVCGGRHLGRTRVLHANGARPYDIADLVAHAEDLAARRGLRSVSFLYVDDDNAPLRALLSERGYVSHESAQYCWLPLPPGGLDAYLDLFSAHRRRRMLAERRSIADAGVRVCVEPLTAAVLPRLGELEAELFAKYGLRDWRPEQSRRFLHQVLDELGQDALVSLARAGGEIRGFGLLLRRGDQWFAHRAGFDYAFQSEGRLPLYYEVLYYTPVELAEAAGVRAIHYGIGSTEAKRSRGCHTITQHSYLLRL